MTKTKKLSKNLSFGMVPNFFLLLILTIISFGLFYAPAFANNPINLKLSIHGNPTKLKTKLILSLLYGIFPQTKLKQTVLSLTLLQTILVLKKLTAKSFTQLIIKNQLFKVTS